MRRAGNTFDQFCREAIDLLGAAGVDYLVIGGLAVIALGDPRMTGDVDVIAFIAESEAERLLDRGEEAGFELERGTERKRLEQTGTLRLLRGRFQLDVIVASLPFERVALGRSRKQRLFGRMVPLPTAEDLILFKVLAGRDKDLVDAVGVARRHRATLDQAYVEQVIQELSDQAEDLGPWNRWQDVLRRAGG